MIVTTLRRYPIKSCRGHDLELAVVDRSGLQGDRRWMLVEPDGAFVTAREVPELLRVTPEPTDGGLVLRHERMRDLPVELPGAGAPMLDVQVWRAEVLATLAGDHADAWFSDVVGYPVRLVHLDDPSRRRPNPAHSEPADRVGFADGYPLLLTSEASLTALNTAIDGEPMTMERFRPNLVIDGDEAWAEDSWSRVRVGEVVFRIAKPCDRCVMTTYDPQTLRRGHEPIRTLSRVHRLGGKAAFGVNLIPDEPGATVEVGAPVEPL